MSIPKKKKKGCRHICTRALSSNIYTLILYLKLGELIYISHTHTHTHTHTLSLPPPSPRWHITLQIGCHPALHPLNELPIGWPAVSFAEGSPPGVRDNITTHPHSVSKQNIASAPPACNRGRTSFIFMETRVKKSLSVLFNETGKMTDSFFVFFFTSR